MKWWSIIIISFVAIQVPIQQALASVENDKLKALAAALKPFELISKKFRITKEGISHGLYKTSLEDALKAMDPDINPVDTNLTTYFNLSMIFTRVNNTAFVSSDIGPVTDAVLSLGMAFDIVSLTTSETPEDGVCQSFIGLNDTVPAQNAAEHPNLKKPTVGIDMGGSEYGDALENDNKFKVINGDCTGTSFPAHEKLRFIFIGFKEKGPADLLDASDGMKGTAKAIGQFKILSNGNGRLYSQYSSQAKLNCTDSQLDRADVPVSFSTKFWTELVDTTQYLSTDSCQLELALTVPYDCNTTAGQSGCEKIINLSYYAAECVSCGKSILLNRMILRGYAGSSCERQNGYTISLQSVFRQEEYSMQHDRDPQGRRLEPDSHQIPILKLQYLSSDHIISIEFDQDTFLDSAASYISVMVHLPPECISELAVSDSTKTDGTTSKLTLFLLRSYPGSGHDSYYSSNAKGTCAMYNFFGLLTLTAFIIHHHVMCH